MNIRLYIANLRAYNEGTLQGEWIELPMDEDVLEATMARITGPQEDELAIHDSDGLPSGIAKETASVTAINRLAQAIEDSDEDEDVIRAILEDLEHQQVDSIVSVVENRDYIAYMDIDGLEDVAYAMAEDDGTLKALQAISSPIAGVDMSAYIDWEALGRDLGIDGWTYYRDLRVAIAIAIG